MNKPTNPFKEIKMAIDKMTEKEINGIKNTMIPDLSNEDYHLSDPYSNSELSTIHKSLASYLYKKENPDPPSTEMTFGSAFHTLILEPDKFDDEFVFVEASTRNTKIYKDAVKEEEDRSVLLMSEAQLLEAMKDSLMNHTIASNMFSGGEAEQSFFWTDPETGIRMKCRPDYLIEKVVVDLKTARDASYDAFLKNVIAYRYFVQNPLYTDGINQVSGYDVEKFVFVVVEKTPPHPVAIYQLDDVAIEHGRMVYREDLATLAAYLSNPIETWTGYPEEIQDMSLPQWAFYK